MKRLDQALLLLVLVLLLLAAAPLLGQGVGVVTIDLDQFGAYASEQYVTPTPTPVDKWVTLPNGERHFGFYPQLGKHAPLLPLTGEHPGYWRWAYSGDIQFVPCVTRPYTDWTDPQTGNVGYQRYDFNATKVSGADGSAGQGGPDHTYQYRKNGHIYPLYPGAGPAGYYPGTPESADICAVYLSYNPGFACPTPDSVYPTRISSTGNWQVGYNYYKPRIDQECLGVASPTPTRTSTPGGPTPSRTATRPPWTPTFIPPTPACDSFPGGPICTPTRTKTPSRTATAIPASSTPSPSRTFTPVQATVTRSSTPTTAPAFTPTCPAPPPCPTCPAPVTVSPRPTPTLSSGGWCGKKSESTAMLLILMAGIAIYRKRR